MKKWHLFCLVLAIACMTAMSSCNGCSGNAPGKEQVTNKFQTDYDGVVPDMSDGASHVIALHRQTMFSLADGKGFAWYQTKFTFADSLDLNTLGDAVLKEVTSTFQTFSPDLSYTITTNAVKGTLIPAPTPGLWIEDFDLGNTDIKLGILDVIERLTAWNGVLPPAVSITLRKPVGPKPCNAQYVIGNPYQVIFVDAVTGDIADWNPAFPR